MILQMLASKVAYEHVRVATAAQLLVGGYPGTLSIISNDLIDVYDAASGGGLAKVVGSGGTVIQEIITAVIAFLQSPEGQALLTALVNALIAMLAGGG